MRIIIILFISTFVVSCQYVEYGNSNSQNDSTGALILSGEDSADLAKKQAMEIDNFVVNWDSIKRDFEIIPKNSGVFIDPDTAELANLKKEYNEMEFTSMIDDNDNYDFEAKEFLKTNSYQIVHPKARYLKFMLKVDTLCVDTKSKYKVGWLRILFKKNAKPRIFNSVDIEQTFNEDAN